jgi:hypothetical protein
MHKLCLLPLSLLLLHPTCAEETPTPPPAESKATFARHILADTEEIAPDEREAIKPPLSSIKRYSTRPSQAPQAKRRATSTGPKGPIEN